MSGLRNAASVRGWLSRFQVRQRLTGWGRKGGGCRKVACKLAETTAAHSDVCGSSSVCNDWKRSTPLKLLSVPSMRRRLP